MSYTTQKSQVTESFVTEGHTQSNRFRCNANSAFPCITCSHDGGSLDDLYDVLRYGLSSSFNINIYDFSPILWSIRKKKLRTYVLGTCNYISHNCNFIVANCDYISQLRLQILHCDVISHSATIFLIFNLTSQLLSCFIYSKTGFHKTHDSKNEH